MTAPHDHLERQMNERRLELRLKWREVAARAGISYEALRAARKGVYETQDDLTKRGIEDALEWEPGSYDQVMTGGEPKARSGQDGTLSNVPWAELVAEISRRLEAHQGGELTIEEAVELGRRGGGRLPK